MNRELETTLAVIGILMLLLALKIWLKLRKIKKTTIMMQEEDENSSSFLMKGENKS